MFRTMVRGWFQKGSASYNDFIQALLPSDLEAINEYMNKVALATLAILIQENNSLDLIHKDFIMDSC